MEERGITTNSRSCWHRVLLPLEHGGIEYYYYLEDEGIAHYCYLEHGGRGHY